MRIHYFTIPVHETEPVTTELNQLLTAHPNAIVEQQLINDGIDAFWVVSVRTTGSVLSSASTGNSVKRARVDYRELLSNKVFSRYAILREFRNRLAGEKGIKPFVIFTNQQLADIAQLPVLDKKAIASVDGVGKTRVDEYADLLIALFEPRDADLPDE